MGWSTRIGLAVGATVIAVVAGGGVASVAAGILQQMLDASDNAVGMLRPGELATDIIGNGIWIFGAAVLFYSLPTFAYLLAFELTAIRHPWLRSRWNVMGAVAVGSGLVLLMVQVVVGGADWDVRTAVAVLGTVVGVGAGLVAVERTLPRRESVQASSRRICE